MLKPEKLVNIQKTLRRGTEVISVDGDKYVFDGFSSDECPHEFCELHPVNINKAEASPNKMCQGFMRWIRKSDNVTLEACPYMGAASLTIDDGIEVKVILKTKNGKTEEIKPESY